MKTLVIKQKRTDGVQKVWRVRPHQSPCTFGTSRVAGVNSIDPTLTPFEGVFQLTEKGWKFIDMNPAHIEDNKTCSIDTSTVLQFTQSEVSFEILEKTFQHVESFNRFQKPAGSGKPQQLFVVTFQGQFLRSQVHKLSDKSFELTEVHPVIRIPIQQSETWVRQSFENYVVQQKTVYLEDVTPLASLPKKELMDEESKKPLVIALSAALILALVGMLIPKPKDNMTRWEPKEAQKIVVNLEDLKKRKVAQVKAVENDKKEIEKQKAGGGGKVAGLLKNLSVGRISKLVGKVSAGEAASKNIVVQQGIKAGTGPSGRALASLGNQEKSSRDWGTEGSGQGVSVSTVGKGGGRSLSGLGGLTAGKTGAGGVGLIEDEGEVSGGLDRDVIAEYIKKQIGHILACYERQLSARKDLAGKVSVKFTIGGTGNVEAQNITESTMRDATVEGCILNRVAKWTFPAPNGGTKVIVTYPFLFKSTN